MAGPALTVKTHKRLGKAALVRRHSSGKESAGSRRARPTLARVPTPARRASQVEYYEETESECSSLSSSDEERDEAADGAKHRELEMYLERGNCETVVFEGSDGSIVEEEIIVIEGDSDDEGSDFERRVRKRLLKQWRKEHERGERLAEGPASAQLRSESESGSESETEETETDTESETESERESPARRRKKRKAAASPESSRRSSRHRKAAQGAEEMQIKWDLEWEAIKDATWRAVGFFVPPVIYMPAMFVLRLMVIWPLLLSVRGALFSHSVFLKTWPLLLDFLRSFVQFPHRLVIRVLEFSEAFAYRVIDHAKRIRSKLATLWTSVTSMCVWVVQFIFLSLWRLLRKARKRVRRLAKRGWRASLGAFDSTTSGFRHLVYLLVLPLRVAVLGLQSCAWAGRITFASFKSIPAKVAHFIVHSPNIFGRSGKRLVRFVKTNRQDILDVCIALVFLTVLGMILSGVFFPLLVNLVKGVVLFAQRLQATLGRMRLPRLRIPRLNLAKLREVLPAFPFSMPSLPVPDVALLLGLRERTFVEKVLYVFELK